MGSDESIIYGLILRSATVNTGYMKMERRKGSPVTYWMQAFRRNESSLPFKNPPCARLRHLLLRDQGGDKGAKIIV